MTGRRRALGLVVAGLTLAGTGLAATGVSDAAAARLVEAPSCARPTGAVAEATAGPGQTVVSFQVAARTRLRVTGGRVVATSTNTGCAPQATDQFVSGTRLATPDEVRAALGAFRTGDWTSPGTWHPAH